MSREIKLTQGKVAIVDDEDYEQVSKHKWYFTGGYARRDVVRIIRSRVYLHLVIAKRMGLSGEDDVDHINGDKLDNRRSNLRDATRTQNNCNRRLSNRNTSGYKGVSCRPDRKNKPFVANIQVNHRPKFLGAFATAEDAARAYDDAARELHGQYAVTNFVT